MHIYIYISSSLRTASGANYWAIPHTFHCGDYFVVGGLRTCLEVFSDSMFQWISSNSCPLNLLLVGSHPAQIIVVKCLIQGRCLEQDVLTRPVWHEAFLRGQFDAETTQACFKWESNPNHAIIVVVKTTPLPSQPRSEQIFPTRGRKPNLTYLSITEIQSIKRDFWF